MTVRRRGLRPRPRSADGWYRHLISYARPYGRLLALGCLLAVVHTLIAVAVPWPLKVAVDHVLVDRPLPGWAGWIDAIPGVGSVATRLGVLGVVIVLLAVADGSLEVGRSVWRRTVGPRMTNDLAHDTLELIQRRSVAAPRRIRSGDLVQRVVADTRCVETLVFGVGMTVFQSSVSIVVLATLMLSVSPVVTAVGLGLTVPMIVMARAFRERVGRDADQKAEAEGRVVAATNDMLVTLPEVQVFGAEAQELARFAREADAQASANLRAERTVLGFNGGIAATTAIGTGLVLAVGGWRVLDGSTTVGELLVVMAYLSSLFGPIEGLVNLAPAVASSKAGARRLLELGTDSGEVVEPKQPVAPRRAQRGSRITFDNVSFGYEPGHAKLSGINLTIEPGETVAIVGPTGAGKSTLVSLVPRFFDPWSGTVLVDETDVRLWRTHDLRRRIAVVRQDPLLLPVSIRDNIAYGTPGVSERRIRQAAVQALAFDFIRDLPDGFETVVGERGTTLSGGQRQRLAIARALCRNAPILILDEPTAALDVEAEASLVDLVTRAADGRTILIVTHRLSTISHADRIVVVERGEIVEHGGHHDLVNRDGLYARYQRLQTFEPLAPSGIGAGVDDRDT